MGGAGRQGALRFRALATIMMGTSERFIPVSFAFTIDLLDLLGMCGCAGYVPERCNGAAWRVLIDEMEIQSLCP